MALHMKPSQGGQQVNKQQKRGGGKGSSFWNKTSKKEEKVRSFSLFHDKDQKKLPQYIFCILFFDSWNLIMDKFHNRQNNKSYCFFLVHANHIFFTFLSCTVVLSDTRKLDFLSFLPNFLYFPSGATLQPPKSENSC